MHGADASNYPVIQVYKHTLHTSELQATLQLDTTSNPPVNYTSFAEVEKPCWHGAGPVVITRVLSWPQRTADVAYSQVLRVGGLTSFSTYSIRAVFESELGAVVGYSTSLSATTLPSRATDLNQTAGHVLNGSVSGVWVEAGNRSRVARTGDPNYIAGHGYGGGSGDNGQDGFCFLKSTAVTSPDGDDVEE
eukprot:gene20080-25464_t